MSAEISRGFTTAEFTRVLTSPKFINHAIKLGKYTVKTSSEGAFAVYKSPKTGKIAISQAHLPTVEQRETERSEYNDFTDIHGHMDPSYAAESINLSRLIYAKSPGVVRRDIGLVVHSHPYGHESLRPSIGDLEIYELQRGNNPNLIQGILTASAQTARILFYKESATNPVVYFHNQLDNEPPAKIMIDMMNQCGFNTTVATLDITTGQYSIPIKQAIGELYK